MSDFSREIEELLNKHESELLRYGSGLLRDLDQAKDLVQNAFLSYIKYTREEGRVVENPRAFLFRCCYTAAMDLLRKSKTRSKHREKLIYEAEQAPPQATPDSIYEEKSMHEQLKKELDKLNEIEQQIFRLKIEREMTYQAIAEAMGLNPGHVGVILHRTLKKLRGRMKKQSEVPSKLMQAEAAGEEYE